ncbi:MAG TPA: hypothetical protein VL093_11205 [Flavipsychrobacter sp.]|nr:hypothetical protein [Flavipsychrobacter sp.]
MFKGIARFIVYSLLCVPLIIVAVLILKQVQYAFNLRDSLLSPANQASYFNVQQAMAANELSTRTFFLIFICFLMILCGLFLLLRGTDNAFHFSKDVKVRYSLKTAYPGAVIAIAGSTLLAYSIYQSQRQQVNITQQLQLLLTSRSQPPVENKETVHVHNAGMDTVKNDVADSAKVLLTVEQQEEEKSDIGIAPVLEAASVPTVATILPEEIDWANQLASRSVAFGYDPTNEDFKAYNDIIARRRNGDKRGGRLDNDLQWAFLLLQRTKGGYQPTDREMSRYESVVTDQLREKDKVTIN